MHPLIKYSGVPKDVAVPAQNKRPMMTKRVVAGLSKFSALMQEQGIAISDKDILAALAYCEKLASVHENIKEKRQSISERVNSYRVTTPPKSITYNGESKGLGQWCKELGFSYPKVYERMRKGEAFESAISDNDNRRNRLRSR